MAKLRINGDSSGYVDLEAPNAASSSTLDLDQVPQKNATTTGFTGNVGVGISTPSTTNGGYDGGNLHVHNSGTGSSVRLTNSTTGTGTSSGMLISKWNDSNTYLTNFDNGANTIFTQSNSSGTLQTTMKLDGDGYVTTPQQPGFQFWNNGSDFTISAGGKVTCFYAGDHNIGSHFDASNQRFTAPVSGYYLFGGHLRIGAPGKIRVARFQIYLNGSRLRDLMSVGGTNDYDGSSGYDHPGASGTAVQYLTVGDYVEMYVDSELNSSNTVYIQGGTNNNRKSYWFGHLLG